MLGVARIFGVDKKPGNRGGETIQKSTEGVKIHVREKCR
jgi:hypothetical protein